MRFVYERSTCMHKQGKKNYEIVSSLGVNKNSVTNWLKAYRAGGINGLKEESRGVKKGHGKLLSLVQEKQVQKWIVDKYPDQLKLAFALWTIRSVKELILQQFGIKIALRTVGDYLNNWGFTPQRPKLKAYEQNSKAVQAWLEEDYVQIKARAEQENAEIQWADETGVKNHNHHGRSYSPKGRRPTRKRMAKRFSINMISSISNQGKVRFMIYKENMSSQVFIKFMRRLLKTIEKKIYLIVDNLRVHHSRIVKSWISEHKDQIEIFYLPSYSPELNPDEYLNCDLKYGMSEKPAPQTKEKLKRNILGHMRKLQKTPKRVQKYFKNKNIAYAA